MAGLLPYLATSMSTLGLAAEINTAHEYGTGYFMNAETAEQLLHLLEPIQVGWGAVVCDFKTLLFHATNFVPDHLLPRCYPLGL